MQFLVTPQPSFAVQDAGFLTVPARIHSDRQNRFLEHRANGIPPRRKSLRRKKRALGET